MRPIKILLFLIVAASSILMGIGAWMYFAPASHPEVKGELVYTELPGQREALDQYFQTHYTHPICVHEFFARDAQHLYLEMVCGKFQVKNNEVDHLSSHRMYRNVRYTANPFTVSGFTNPEDGSFHGKSLVRMFPEKIFQDFIVHKGSDRTYESLMKKIRAKLEDL